MFNFCSLYSGSSGNSLFVQTENTKILIDAGESAKKITEALSLINVDVNDLDEEKADKLKNKFDCKLPMGFIKGLCGKYNNEDPTNSEVDYLAYLLLSDDIIRTLKRDIKNIQMMLEQQLEADDKMHIITPFSDMYLEKRTTTATQTALFCVPAFQMEHN